jgi:ERCC4-type nuclease
MPDVHPHALKGAIVSLALMWRLPVVWTRESLLVLRFLAQQVGEVEHDVLKRYHRKPKRLASRRVYMLQGLPRIGPALAHRLLVELGSVERVITADEATLTRVRGVGPKTASRIRQLASSSGSGAW